MKKISRRSFLAAAGLSVAALALTACGGSSASTASSVASSAAASSEAASTSAAAGELTTVEAGKLTMATNAAFPPYEMTTDAGEFEGIDIETAQAIADKLGMKLVIDDMAFDATITAVQTGKADMVMAGLTVTEERKEQVNFTTSYATGVQVIIVREGDTKIAGTNDDLQLVDANGNVLEGLTIGVQSTTTGDLYSTWYMEDEGLATVQRYNKGADAVAALLSGKIDCVIIDNEPAKAFVEANNK